MGFIETVLSVFVVTDLFIWWLSLRAMGRAAHRGLRLTIHGFFLAQLTTLAVIVWTRSGRVDIDTLLPTPIFASFYIWHFLVGPLAFVVGLAGLLGESMFAAARFFRPGPLSAEVRDSGISRREFLGIAVGLMPLVVTFSLSAFATAQLPYFRVRHLTIVLPSLPPALDGMTIAHLSDLHVGPFTNGRVLKAITDTTNELQPDLVLFTGDLINGPIQSLAPAIETLRGIHAPVALCTGNHDLFERKANFERRVKDAGLCLLFNETAILRVRGVRVQLLGLRWCGPQNWQNHADESNLAACMENLLSQRDPKAFPILLAHHPHAWDYSGDIPLTLSGHTHGGQLMLNEETGFGPMMFRYWSGLYTRPATAGQPAKALVVSNGVGNWFPLRSEAPAEIIHITLRKE